MLASVCPCEQICVYVEFVIYCVFHQYIIPLFCLFFLLHQEKINYPKGGQKYSCCCVGTSDDVRSGGRILHMIDFQTLLICDGDFSADECAIDALLPAL